ncbi:MAG: DNA topoisomerase 4 subunit A [Clostridia bacterium]|nr:DNA topoisomerase (ATP-hydrolyzing) [Candidatus Pelethousia sp.]NCB30963.1 DNA topoisomerase 4 subunit A [Clostridia bacterium]
MAKKDIQTTMGGEIIIDKSMDIVLHDSMIPYAEYVILERALPRVEDGLKPVQRRILYTMQELGISPDKPHRKSARIVGDCLGKYHPHGDTSVYDAMVRMAQNFNMQMPLVDGHGNFGSVDGDSAAAMRYTEARMAPIALELLRDLDKETVKFSLNFDDTLKEPDVLPGRFPNLLVNGASGIAVGLATNIPPHNLKEAIDAVLLQMEDPDISLEKLMGAMPCPDFPTGGYLIRSDEIRTAYETGRGKLTMRAKTHMEDMKNGRRLIVITELPYQVNKAKALEDILKVSQEKKALFAGVADIRDESDRMGMRAVIEVKKDADADKLLQYLYKYSDLQMTFGVNMVAIAGGKPQQMGLKEMIAHYIRHQEDVVTRRTRFDLDAAKRREHILEGLMVAINNIDEVIALIRASKTPKEAREALIARFQFTEIQAQAILDLRLQRLTNLELLSIEKEYKQVKALIKELLAILDSPKKLRQVIRKELNEIRETYGIPRRTQLADGEGDIEIAPEDVKPVEEVLIALLPDGKIRRLPRRSYNVEQLSAEAPLQLIETATDKRLRFFTSLGACCSLAVEEIPETRQTARPANLNALIAFEKDEAVVACLEEEECAEKLYFYTMQGNVKCTDGNEYNTRTRRLAAISLKAGDSLMGVEPERENGILLITRQGMSIRFERESVPMMGRVSGGVKCIKMEDGDAVVFAGQVGEEGEVLTISDRGYAKRSFIFDHELQGRNGKGLKAFDFKKNGSNGVSIAAALYVREPYTFMVEQSHGTITEVNTEDVLIESRAGKGMLLVMVLLDDVVIGARRSLL